jgi:hypothetical protein
MADVLTPEMEARGLVEVSQGVVKQRVKRRSAGG